MTKEVSASEAHKIRERENKQDLLAAAKVELSPEDYDNLSKEVKEKTDGIILS